MKLTLSTVPGLITLAVASLLGCADQNPSVLDAGTEASGDGAVAAPDETSPDGAPAGQPDAGHQPNAGQPDAELPTNEQPGSLGTIVPLFDESTELEPKVLFDRGDAMITRFGDRGRDRHAREDQFQSYDH
jgi:hypothetical protein